MPERERGAGRSGRPPAAGARPNGGRQAHAAWVRARQHARRVRVSGPPDDGIHSPATLPPATRSPGGWSEVRPHGDYAVPSPEARRYERPHMCAAVTPPNTTSWNYAEAWLPEDDFITEARAKGAELGCPAVGRGGASALTLVAALLDAHAVVEVGTGAGVSGLALLRGMRSDGILTSVDVEAENQRGRQGHLRPCRHQPDPHPADHRPGARGPSPPDRRRLRHRLRRR